MNPNKREIIYPIILISLVLIISLVYSKSLRGFILPSFSKKPANTNNIPDFPKQSRKVKIPILLYHYVEVVTDKRDYIRSSLAITPSNFENQLISIKNAGYSFYQFRDVGNILNGTNIVGKPVIITFDDGYGDFYTEAFPILKRLNVKATVFINSGLMGKPNYMTPEQVKEVLASGLVEVGGHGYSHLKLTSINAELAKETVKKDVDEITFTYGKRPVSFAYPYGFYNQETIKAVKDAGYLYAATLLNGWTVNDNSLYEISRIRPGMAGNKDLGEFLNSL